jgi:hypothetical protein
LSTQINNILRNSEQINVVTASSVQCLKQSNVSHQQLICHLWSIQYYHGENNGFTHFKELQEISTIEAPNF